MDYYITSVIAIAVVLALLLLSSKRRNISSSSSKRPPGPSPLPIIGNLHLLGKEYYKSLGELAKIYGPVMSLRLGQLEAVVITSPEGAKQVVQKQDEAFANKWVPKTIHALDHHKHSVVFLPFNSRFRSVRKAMNSSMFSSTRLDASHRVRSNKVEELLQYCRGQSLRGEAVGIEFAGFVTSMNNLSCTMFSKNMMDPNSENTKEMRDVMCDILRVTVEPNLADFFPFMKEFGVKGRQCLMIDLFSKVLKVFTKEISERLALRNLHGHDTEKDNNNNNNNNDALDFLLTMMEENPQEFDQTLIERMFLDSLIAGADTTSGTIEWAMTELLRNPEIMKKAKQELARVVGKGKQVKETDIDKLPYLQCILKETFRLHPPIPVLLPRQVEQDVEFLGYVISKGTKVLINVWAIMRDPSIWKNPLIFNPERFCGSEVEPHGLHFEFLPFGSGRRICPGMSLAKRIIPIMLGSLLNSFDWKLEGDVKPEELDVEEKLSIVLKKARPLHAIPVPL